MLYLNFQIDASYQISAGFELDHSNRRTYLPQHHRVTSSSLRFLHIDYIVWPSCFFVMMYIKCSFRSIFWSAESCRPFFHSNLRLFYWLPYYVVATILPLPSSRRNPFLILAQSAKSSSSFPEKITKHFAASTSPVWPDWAIFQRYCRQILL